MEEHGPLQMQNQLQLGRLIGLVEPIHTSLEALRGEIHQRAETAQRENETLRRELKEDIANLRESTERRLDVVESNLREVPSVSRQRTANVIQATIALIAICALALQFQ